jgi:murein L,D-transpeptidase YafK
MLAFSQSFKDEQERFPRVRQARENQQTNLDSLFENRNIDYPPHRVVIVAYKREQQLELWACSESSDTYTLIKQYPFTAFSGTLGPKQKRGDLQIPEGLYHISHFNPYSNFHLSMLVSYPNKADAIRSPYDDLGGEIRIHGSCVTIGCIPIGDQAIEELYITCVDVKSNGENHIPVYIFPGHMDYTGLLELQNDIGTDVNLQAFWYNLKQGYDIFATTHQRIDFSIDTQGVYVFKNKLYSYPWHVGTVTANQLIDRIPPPEGYDRIRTPVLSFAAWLQHIPLKPGNPSVRLYDGTLKAYQGGHAAIIDISVGTRDLQQCADAIMRLHAEFMYSINACDAISFIITNGDTIPFRTWINGYRPYVSGSTVAWDRTAVIDSSYSTLTGYLEFIYSYAGSYSLSRQLKPVPGVRDMRIGDIFIQGGFPGHAVIVMDMAVDPQNLKKVFLLAQSYMPAQDVHILRNLTDPVLSPWYSIDFGDTLYTPEWTFTENDLMRF